MTETKKIKLNDELLDFVEDSREIMLKDGSMGEKKGKIYELGVPFNKVSILCRYIKQEYPKDFPAAVKGGRMGVVNRTIIEVFLANKKATEKDLYNAFKKVVKNDRCAKDYTKQYYRMARALANGLNVEQIIEKAA